MPPNANPKLSTASYPLRSSYMPTPLLILPHTASKNNIGDSILLSHLLHPSPLESMLTSLNDLPSDCIYLTTGSGNQVLYTPRPHAYVPGLVEYLSGSLSQTNDEIYDAQSNVFNAMLSKLPPTPSLHMPAPPAYETPLEILARYPIFATCPTPPTSIHDITPTVFSSHVAAFDAARLATIMNQYLPQMKRTVDHAIQRCHAAKLDVFAGR